jgi:hypothetical protein
VRHPDGAKDAAQRGPEDRVRVQVSQRLRKRVVEGAAEVLAEAATV